MSNWREEMKEEHDELTERIEKLRAFIASDKYGALWQVERSDLTKQVWHMQEYFNVLSRRISRDCGVEESKVTIETPIP